VETGLEGCLKLLGLGLIGVLGLIALIAIGA
jgi:hypothetical protein